MRQGREWGWVRVRVRVGVSWNGEQGRESGRVPGECRAETEQDKRVGRGMESTGNTAKWRGNGEGKVRKASMQVMEKRWHGRRGKMRRLGREEEKLRKQAVWAEGGCQVREQSREVKRDSLLLPAVSRN